MRSILLFSALCLSLSACDPAGPSAGGNTGYSASASAIASADCGAEQYEYLVGGPIEFANDIRYDGPFRILGPEDAITKDYNPHRLTVTTRRGPDGDTVGRVICS